MNKLLLTSLTLGLAAAGSISAAVALDAGLGVNVGAQTSAGTNSAAGATVGTGLGLSGGSLVGGSFNGSTGGHVTANSPAALDATVNGQAGTEVKAKARSGRSLFGDRSHSTGGVSRAGVTSGVSGTVHTDGRRAYHLNNDAGLEGSLGGGVRSVDNKVDTNANIGTNVGLEVDGDTATSGGTANIRSNVNAAGGLQ